MSEVLPNGQIRFLSNVPLDKNYENTVDFTTKNEQTNYFLSIVPVKQMIGCTRVREGVIKVNCISDEILSANYVMFQNQNFSDKWFYAFIINVEYINNGCCHVYYAIDDMQTWMFDYELAECYVEREHTATDGMFEHTVDEGLNVSEYMTISKTNKDYSTFCAILYTSIDPYTNNIASCQINNGTAKGLTGFAFDLQDGEAGAWLTIRDNYKDCSDPTVAQRILDSGNGLELLNYYIYLLTTQQQKDAIAGVVMVPKFFVGNILSRSHPVMQERGAITDEFIVPQFTSSNSLAGNYLPKNKKLYNAPFCLIDVVTADGQTMHLQPELITENLPDEPSTIDILSEISPSPSLTLVPWYYAGNEIAWEKAITFDSFPQIAVSVDGYLAWVASGGLKQLQNQAVGAVAGGLLGVAGGIATANPIGAVSSTLNTALSIDQAMTKLDVAKSLPPEIKGRTDSTPLVANKLFQFEVRKMSAKSDIIKSIDDYFTMYGYKVNKVKTPNRRNRPHYTYIKTKGCKVNGGAPADALERIQAIYDNGIRFWINPATKPRCD